MTTILRDAWRGSRALTALAALMALLLAVCLAGLALDGRTLLGQPVWLKPAKFAASFVVAALTLAWLLAHAGRGRRAARATGRVAAGVVAVTAVLEVGIIVAQAARGRPSHFDSETPLDAMLWRGMGLVILVLWAATLLITVLLWRDPPGDPALAWAGRLGLVILLVGMLQALLMLVPTRAQLDADARGAQTLLGAHAVGVADGGPGLPLLGWSTTGGDLRVGHFVGIHGLQVLLLAAMLLGRMVADPVRRTRLVFVAAGGYAGLLALVTWQALRGQPLLAPDGPTLAALGALLLGTAAAAAVSLS